MLAEDKLYIKYFNYGYLLAATEPKVLERLLDVKFGDEAIEQALSDGFAQFEHEQEVEQILNIGKVRKRTNQITKDKDIEPDV